MSSKADDKLANLRYLHAMLGQLRDMAAQADSGMLVYLIEMSQIEANDEIRKTKLKIETGGKQRNSAA